jgi:hypothetical protein
MKARLGWLVAVVGAGAVALSAAAQGSAKLAVGPDAGGYLCPDGRQLYVKSCYDDLPDANCGVLSLDRWTTGTLRVQAQATKTRSDVQKEVSGCKLYPVAFDNGVVSLVLPKSALPQQTAKGPAAAAAPKTSTATPSQTSGDALDLTVPDGMAFGYANVRSSLVRISPADATSQVFYVDEASRKATANTDVITIWALIVYADGKPPVAGDAATWIEYQVSCKQNSYDMTLYLPLDRQAKMLRVGAGDLGGSIKKGSLHEVLAGIACRPAPPFKGPRFASAKTAIADAFAGVAPKSVAKPATPAAKPVVEMKPTKATIRLPNTDIEKKIFQAIRDNRLQAAIDATAIPRSLDSDPIWVWQLTDAQGMTALHWAAANRNAIATRWLLDGGSEADLADEKGRTPLKIALDNKDTQVMMVLLDIGRASARFAWPGHDDALKGFKKTTDLVDFLIKNAAPAKN